MKKAFLLKNNNIIEFLQINSSYIAHIGIGILVIGITAGGHWQEGRSGNELINSGAFKVIKDFKLLDDILRSLLI